MDKEENDKLPVFILGHSMGSSVALLATTKCLENTHLSSRIKKLVVTGELATLRLGLLILLDCTDRGYHPNICVLLWW